MTNIKKSFSPNDYIRLFRFTDVPLLLDFLYLDPKKDNKVLAINSNNQRTVYFPKDEFEKALKEGEKIYNTKERGFEFELKLRKAADSFLKICNKLSNQKISKEDFHNLGEKMSEFYWFYDRTDFLYTDSAFKKGLIQNSLPNFGKLKEDMRKVINNILLSENGLVYPILKSISEQFNINYSRLLFYTPEELNMVFDGQTFDDSICEERRNFYVVFGEDGNLVLRKDTHEIAQKFSLPSMSNFIKGISASKGKVSGKAVIFPDNILSFSDLKKAMNKMKKGDILVAETTSPEIMPACAKATAIVTNQGGLMSHAAIVSRELKIPCIVGTQNATSFLRTGDLVEVDANNGIVKILKKS